MTKTLLALFALPLAIAPSLAAAQTIHVGVTISQTGPAASLGIPQKNSIGLLPTEVAGHKLDYMVLDDGSDSTKAVTNLHKFLEEDHADVVIGSSTTPVSLAMIDLAAQSEVPMLSLAASQAIIAPMDAKKHWVFKMPQNDSLMAEAIGAHMAKTGVKTVAFIGFSDAYGDGWLREMQRVLGAKKIELVDIERYGRTDTSVTGQVLKMISAKPDAILVAGSGTPAALPQKTLHEQGYDGKYYQTHGVANLDFIRVGGKDVEGTILPVGPVVVADQLPANNPIRAVATKYIQGFDKLNGSGSVAFGSYAYDAGLLLQDAIPVALKAGAPGTPAFRGALRDALEQAKALTVTNGVIDMTASDHNGLDTRARVMATIKDGAFKLLPVD